MLCRMWSCSTNPRFLGAVLPSAQQHGSSKAVYCCCHWVRSESESRSTMLWYWWPIAVLFKSVLNLSTNQSNLTTTQLAGSNATLFAQPKPLQSTRSQQPPVQLNLIPHGGIGGHNIVVVSTSAGIGVLDITGKWHGTSKRSFSALANFRTNGDGT